MHLTHKRTQTHVQRVFSLFSLHCFFLHYYSFFLIFGRCCCCCFFIRSFAYKFLARTFFKGQKPRPKRNRDKELQFSLSWYLMWRRVLTLAQLDEIWMNFECQRMKMHQPSGREKWKAKEKPKCKHGFEEGKTQATMSFLLIKCYY